MQPVDRRQGQIDQAIEKLRSVWTDKTHPLSHQFCLKIIAAAELHARKQQDYGADNDPFYNLRAAREFGITPLTGVLLRMNDKMTRLKAFAQKGRLVNESAEDSLADLAVYATIARVLMDEEAAATEAKKQ
jgi:hypothetical protein